MDCGQPAVRLRGAIRESRVSERMLARLCRAALVVMLIGSGAAAQSPANDPVVARVTITAPADLPRFMALGLDMLEMRDGNDLFILTTSIEVDRLRADGWTIRVDLDQTSMLERQRQEQRQRRTRPRLQPQPELFMGSYRTVGEMRATLDDHASQYPNLAEVFVYGSSWERITGGPAAGHDLFGIKLTNRQRPGPKPTLFFMAAIHARELSTSELALRFVDHLLSGYGIDGDVTWLLDEHLIVVVPVANPDGRVLAEQGYLQRKNTDTSHGSCTVPHFGVDLNRSADFKWGVVNGPTESPCGETYPGPVPASEPEITALQSLVRSLFADQRGPSDTDAAPITTTGILLTIHSYSNLVLWPWGWTGTPAPNAAALSALGRKFASYNGYTAQQSILLYPTSGTTDDWAYGELGIAAFTFEVGPGSGACGGFFPPFSCLDGGTGGAFWPGNLPAFLYAARIARAPYDLVRGPTAETATATVLLDGRVNLEARFDERANGAQSIVAAEYYVDTPPWSGGTAVAMTAADGTFDSTVELATALVGPFTERRLIFVRGQDDTGAWGAVRAVFTPDPACVASLSPTSQSLAATGGSGTVTVTIPDGCAWTAGTAATWITIASGASGAGAGSVTYSAAANTTTTARTATIAIAGQVFTVAEAGQVPADLRATQVSAPPAAAAPGTSFSVTSTTENVGGVTAPGSTTRFYLSIDGAKDAGDKLLSGSRAVPALDPGSAAMATATVTIPATTALGTYRLLACADDTGSVPEGNEQNNCIASGATVRVTRPDLVETVVSVTSVAAAPGSNVSVTDTVANQGAVGSGASTTRYYLSADPQKGGGDTLLTASRAVPMLAPAVISTGTVTVTLPTGIALGSYYVLACADDANVVVETDESNNCGASTGTLQVTRADLVETVVSNPPASAAPGGKFTVTDTIKNQGGVTSAASTTRYYLSAEGQWDTGDTRLSGSRTVPALAAGASSAGAAVTVTIPPAVPLGAYYLLACADDTKVVTEIDEGNNCRASAATVQVTRPDLVVTTVSSPPAARAPGSSFTVTDTTLNQGGVAAAASMTRYYLSTDGQKAGAILLASGRAVPALAPGTSSGGAALTVTIPSTAPLNTYYLLACADYANVVIEIDEGNNCLASASPIQVARADLVETAVSDPPVTAAAGGTFTVTDTVQNQGGLAAPASTTRYYLSTDAQRGAGDILLTASRAVPGLAPGASSPGAPVTVTIPSATPASAYYVLACADDTKIVTETSEGNCRASATAVTVSR
jgi:subtilase family serine protease